MSPNDRLISSIVLILACAGCGSQAAAPVPPQYAHPPAPVRCPHPDPAPPNAFDARELIGLKLRAAGEVARRRGCELRVREGDLTGDVQFNRIDVYVRDGTVVGVRES
ncbi:MAG TPA: hypothetical protein VFZ00_10195 [Solirubrobacter sp.]|nr:hypothetical protein [Solirubrobacter sp.]